MFKLIYNLFFPDKKEKISKEIKSKYEKAINFQRNGNIRDYSVLMNEIANLEDELARLNNDSGN
tara:strand:- start:168 stop:359 length:192 start_codon:yes stop_codon:yes gene_type:complete